MSSRTEDTEERKRGIRGFGQSVFTAGHSVTSCRPQIATSTVRGVTDSALLQNLRALRVLRAMSPFSSGIYGLGRHKPHFLKLSEKPKQHLLGIDPLMEPEASSFGCISHDVITEIEDCLSEWP
jgi:hypothetical protein